MVGSAKHVHGKVNSCYIFQISQYLSSGTAVSLLTINVNKNKCLANNLSKFPTLAVIGSDSYKMSGLSNKNNCLKI